MADRRVLPAVAGLLIVLASCAAPVPSAPAATVSELPPMVLHWMSFTHHQEPRNQLLFEGGEPASFTELRLVALDGSIIATANPMPSAEQTLRICGGNPKLGQPPASYGALRATLTLASQQLLSDFLRSPERYRVDVLAGGRWVQPRLVHECDAQE